MGRRTIAGHKLSFHKWRDRSSEASPSDLGGKSLADIFEEWAKSRSNQGVIKVADQSFLRIERVERYNGNIVLVETMSGKAGEEGIVYNTNNSEAIYELTAEDVPTSEARAVLLCPPRGQAALWFSEYSARSSGASLLLGLFEKEWGTLNTGYTFDKTRLIAKEIAIESGIVTELEVRLIRRSNDRAEGLETVEGVVSHRFKPTKKKPLPGGIINTLRKNPAKAYELVEIDSPTDAKGAEIFVSVEVDGRKRKVQIFNSDDGVYFREELNGPDKPTLSDNEIVEYCTAEAVTFLERCGGEWLPEWSKRGR